jgi:hypothetical protein
MTQLRTIIVGTMRNTGQSNLITTHQITVASRVAREGCELQRMRRPYTSWGVKILTVLGQTLLESAWVVSLSAFTQARSSQLMRCITGIEEHERVW